MLVCKFFLTLLKILYPTPNLDSNEILLEYIEFVFIKNEINLDISEETLGSLNERFTLVVDMKVYEIISLVSQSIGLKTVISDDFKEVLIHD